MKDDVDVIKANLNYVVAMISSDKFDKHFEKDFLQKSSKKSRDILLEFFTQLVIKSQINLKKHNCINDDLEKLMRQIRHMKEIHQIDSEISGYYEIRIELNK